MAKTKQVKPKFNPGDTCFLYLKDNATPIRKGKIYQRTETKHVLADSVINEAFWYRVETESKRTFDAVEADLFKTKSAAIKYFMEKINNI